MAIDGSPAYMVGNLADATNWSFHADIDATQDHGLLVDLKVWRSFEVVCGAGGTVWLEKDFGTAVSPESIALDGHSIPSDAVVKAYAGAAPAPAALIGTFTWRALDMILTGLATSARYWRIEISNVANKTMDIGQIPFGTRVIFTESFAWPYREYDQRKVNQKESVGGLDLSEVLSELYTLDASFAEVLDATADELATLDAAVKGSVPFVFQPSNTAAPVYYGRKTKDQPREISGIQVNELPFRFQEDPLADQVL